MLWNQSYEDKRSFYSTFLFLSYIVLIIFRKNNIAPRMRTKNKNLWDITWNLGLSHYTNIFTCSVHGNVFFTWSALYYTLACYPSDSGHGQDSS